MQEFFGYNDFPWIRRGEAYTTGVESGLFEFNNHSGGGFNSLGFRVVLAI